MGVRALLVLAALLAAPATASARVVVVATGIPQVALIDVAANAVSGSAAVPGPSLAVAAAPDGTRAYVAAGRGVAWIDLAGAAVAAAVPLPGAPRALAVSPDGARVYAARRGAIDVLDTAGATLAGSRRLKGTPRDLAVTADRAVLVQRGGRVVVLDLVTNHVVRRLRLPGASGVSADARGRAWVSAAGRLVG